MAVESTQEVTTPPTAPGVGGLCTTFSKVFGDLSCDEPQVSSFMAAPKAAITTVFPSQISGQNMTYLPSFTIRMGAGDVSFRREEPFTAELKNVVAFFKLQGSLRFYIFCQSWGACLGSAYAATRPNELQCLVLAGGVASLGTYLQDLSSLRRSLPEGVRVALEKAEDEQDFESPGYQEAVVLYYKTYFCQTKCFPEDLMENSKILVKTQRSMGQCMVLRP